MRDSAIPDFCHKKIGGTEFSFLNSGWIKLHRLGSWYFKDDNFINPFCYYTNPEAQP